MGATITGKKIWMDGELVDWEKATVHVLTHTLHYGLGVFEGIRLYKTEDGRSAIFRNFDHTKRLLNSAKIVQLEVKYTVEELMEANKEVVRANDLEQGYIRPLIFIGEGGMGLYPGDNPVITAIAAWSWGAYLGEEGINNGIRVKTSSYTRYPVNVFMTKSKTVGAYVNSILAKREAVSCGYDEALMLDPDGFVAEASGENIFIVQNGVLITTPPTSILPGITRDTIIHLAEEMGIKVKEERFTRDAVYIADEAFFSGTAAEITPIREVDDRVIGEGKPGPITKELQKQFFDIVHGKNNKYIDWLDFI